MKKTSLVLDGLFGKVQVTAKREFDLTSPRDLRDYADWLEINEVDEYIFRDSSCVEGIRTLVDEAVSFRSVIGSI